MIGSHFARATRARGWPTFGLARNSAAMRLAAHKLSIKTKFVSREDAE